MKSKNITRIAMWSGPRNISTAMMRSFENRKDTIVIDEPFYAYYLKKSDLVHPGKDQILKSQNNNWHEVVEQITSELPDGATIYYQKHMAHHIFPNNDIGWVKSFKNCFLIRHPKEVIISYSKKNKIKNASDLGFIQQVQLFKKIKNITGTTPAIFDSMDILLDPKVLLKKLCKYLEIEFSNKMLKWPKGIRDTDGVWASHWYKNVINSDGFKPYNKRNENLNINQIKLFEESMDHYNYLSSFKI
tara:strand:- start:39 stop:773 length:735 start_codon:yes stop_codon:yes gene_type:complete